MTGKVSRHDRLSDAAAPPPGDRCHCCDEPLGRDTVGKPTCDSCGYPDNSAAWVDYDGCR